jgi:hypothetical protein
MDDAERWIQDDPAADNGTSISQSAAKNGYVIALTRIKEILTLREREYPLDYRVRLVTG